MAKGRGRNKRKPLVRFFPVPNNFGSPSPFVFEAIEVPKTVPTKH